MNEFERRLLENKTRFIRSFRDDLKADFQLSVPEGYGFSHSDYFHFGTVDGLKYVHKDALRFIFSNAGTYQLHEPSPTDFTPSPSAEQRAAVEKTIDTLFEFFRGEINQHQIYPEFIKESERFFVFKFYSEADGWKKVNSLSRKDANYIKANYRGLSNDPNQVITPLYNQMHNKMLINQKTGEIKFVDLKSFELRPLERPMVYFYNGRVNQLYVLGIALSTRQKLTQRFAVDYPVADARIKRYFF